MIQLTLTLRDDYHTGCGNISLCGTTLAQTMIFQLATHVPFFLTKQWRTRGRVRRLGPPPPPYLALVWDWNSSIDRIVYHFWTGWFFLMKRALHFATKLNSRDNQKCNCFWVPSYDLFASARNAVHGRGPRNYNVQPRLVGGDVGWSNLPQKVQQPFPNQSLDPPPPPHSPNQKFPWIRPCKIICRALLLNVSNVVAPVNVFSCLQVAEHGVRYKRQQSGYIFFYLYK